MTQASWARVQRSIRANNCKCGIKRSMERDELMQVARTDNCAAPKYICPALDLALRLHPAPKEEDQCFS
jgi:hypothetical protein